MSTSIIKSTTWDADSRPPARLKLKVRTYWRARPHGMLLGAEIVLLAGALLAALHSGKAASMMPAMMACILVFHVSGLHDSIAVCDPREFVTSVVNSTGMGVLLALGLGHFVPALYTDKKTVLEGALTAGCVPLLLRPVLRSLIRRKRFVEGILIVGTGELAGKLYRALAKAPGHWRGKKGPLQTPIEFPAAPRGGAAVIDCDEIPELAARERISRVIVAERDSQRRTEVAAALLDCRLRGLRVTDAVDFYEKLSGKIWLEGLHPQWLVYTDGFDRSRLTVCLKRCLDLLFAALLLLLTSPVLLIVAAAIRLDSGGPVLFRQVRVGQHGKPFVLYKFRSMRQDAEAETGPVWAREHDSRVTAVGKILRKFRLDEIPQAFNVLRGDMSFVGPRPERPFFVQMLRPKIPFYDLRHCVKPGITGWAQIEYPYGASIEDAYEKLQYDLYYAKHMSLRCDAVILLRTLGIVLFGRGR